MGKKETFSFRFDSDIKEDLGKLMNSKKYETVTGQIENNIILLKNICTCTESELRNYFNIFEGEFMVKIFKDVIVDYTEKLSVKDYLTEIFEIGRYNFNEKSNIDFEKLSDKIYKLNDIQAFVIINQIVDYYNDSVQNIHKLSIIDSDNIYSIDIVYKELFRNVDKEIKLHVSNKISKEYVIDDSIKLKVVDVPGYNVTSIIFRSSYSLDLSQKFELKMNILNELKKISDVTDININNVCL